LEYGSKLLKTKFPLVTGFGKEENPLIGTSRVINLYIRQHSKKSDIFLVPMPGITELKTPSITGEGRLLHTDQTNLYGVIHDKVYEITFPGGVATFTTLGTILTTVNPMEAATNEAQQTLFVDGVDGWLWDPGVPSFTQVTASGFPGQPESITYQDGYFIVSEGSTAKFFISGLNDGTSWDPLNFASIQSKPDIIVALANLHRRLYIFGKVSTEVWYNAGAADFPFRRDNDSLLEYGCAAKNSVTVAEDKLFWLASHENGSLSVQMVLGYRPVQISTPTLEDAIEKYDTVSDAIGHSYENQGYTFYELTFPTQDITWVYNIDLNQWYERQMQDRTRFIANAYSPFEGTLYLLDYQNGTLYDQYSNYFTYAGDAINRIVISPHFKDPSMNEIQINQFQLPILPGVGNPGVEPDPFVWMSISKNNGFTFQNKQQGFLGKIGEFNKILRWYRLGVSGGNLGGDWVFKIEYYGKTDFMIGNPTIDYEVMGG
jgi:hypothetical protein